MIQYDNAKILLVDDNPVNLKLLTRMLNDSGYNVRAAIDGETALISVRESPPDLILLDINMPVMNGYELAEHLKNDRITSDIPIIFISALDDTESILNAFEHGGVDYISKPFQFAEVDARVQTHLTISLQQKLLLEFHERDQQRLIQISKSEALYRDLFDNAQEIIQSVDENDDFIYVNPHWHNLLGYSEDEMSRMNFTEIIHPDYLENYQQIIESIRLDSTKSGFIDTIFITKGGVELFVQGNISVYQDENMFYTRGIFRDLTLQRVIEKEALELVIQNERSSVLSDFIRNSSHELRTPLTIIAQQLYMIKRLATNDKQLEKVKIAEMKVKDVDNVINQLYQLTTISANDTIDVENVNIRYIIEEQLKTFAEKNIEKELALFIDYDSDDLSIEGSRNLLAMMVKELLDNAFRYTEIKDEIHINLSYTDENYVLLTIRDTGIGIDKKHQHYIFDSLYKVNEARTPDGSGAGIGLSIVKRVVELHDGQVQVMSQLGTGTQFNILLPIKRF
ncbi:MAG: response regulator [Phototrophicaceae bacterium]